ncbi:uncharacterized protein LOC127843074 isoform X2 [Dreissena polymorpha]|uniref:uncharacterized protein LOC127843074 isoform X2 n=1 Tax=Dreissena polymorpha TaxID=45954 RepID=UPI002264D4CC|nr:uncharacterized protein LOC127843074 isoform X2 [Dreissena polymorpha]XP_052228847.1 uncharacterized protein LOC127843074 isoform X2 [Dreissena polymorpha]
MADKFEGRKESNPEWNEIYNRRAERPDQIADESDERKESNTEWDTQYNRSSEQHNQNELATDVRHTQINSKTDDCIITSTKGTQTYLNALSEENITIIAEEMAREFHQLLHTMCLDEEFKSQLRDLRGCLEHSVSFVRKMFSSSETKTDAEIKSSLVNDEYLNSIMQQTADRLDMNQEELRDSFSKALSGLHASHQAQLIDKAEMVSNGPDQFDTLPEVKAKLMTGQIPRTRTNQVAIVVPKKASVKPRQTHCTYAQTEPYNQYDTSEESLKATARQLCGQMFRSFIEPKDVELCTEDGFLEMLSNSSFGDFGRFLQKYCSLLIAEFNTCDELMNTLGGLFGVEANRSSSQTDTEKTNATDGKRTQPEITEALKTVAEEISQALDFYTDADEVALMNMRHFPGFDQPNEKLITLMGISRDDSSVMEINIDHNKGCGDNEQNAQRLFRTGTLSKLIRDHLDKRKLRDDDQNVQTILESSFSQPTLEAHQKDESVSLATSVCMSCIGYGPDIRKQRIEWYRKFGRRFNFALFGFSSIMIVGSKAEGLTRFFESDFDLICLLNRIICIENDKDTSGIDINTTVLIMETDDRCPGYCRLMLSRYNSSFVYHALNRALLKDEAGRLFLSSDGFLKLTGGWFLSSPQVMYLPRAGPSLPMFFQNLHFDRVVALPCQCPDILNRWAERPRNWPPPDVVQKVVSLEVFVAPVGFKDSNSYTLEWRYCFNRAETELIINLNDTQTKLYVLLKMVVKDILKPRRKEITSYMVKNIVLWLTEKNQQTLFHEKSLLHWLHKGLGELRTAIATKNLEYYMIPERNLMATSGLENDQQSVWVDTLTAMMDEGPMVILRFQKIRQAIISYPEPLLWYNKIRTEFELILFVVISLYAPLLEFKPLNDSAFHEYNIRSSEILHEVHKRLNKEGIWFYDIWDLMLRMMR